MPIVCVTIYFLIFVLNGKFFIPENFNPWKILISYTIGFWAVFILPFYVTLLTSLINEVETKSNSWKQLLCLGISKNKIFFNKVVSVIILFFISLQFLILLVVCAGLLLILIKPEFGFQNYKVPIFEILIVDGYVLISSYSIIIIHFFLSIFFNKIFFSLSVGLILSICNTVITNSDFAYLFPWSHPSLFIGKIMLNANFTLDLHVIFMFILSTGFLIVGINILSKKMISK